MRIAMGICLQLDMQVACCALARARENTGNRIAARMAMIAITTSSSIRVNAFRFIFRPSCALDVLPLGRILAASRAAIRIGPVVGYGLAGPQQTVSNYRSEEHTSELQ